MEQVLTLKVRTRSRNFAKPRLIGLKALLFAEGITQRALSIRSAIPETRLSALINGRAVATPDERAVLSSLLKTPELELFPVNGTELEAS
jgi:hypothetical protein